MKKKDLKQKCLGKNQMSLNQLKQKIKRCGHPESLYNLFVLYNKILDGDWFSAHLFAT